MGSHRERIGRLPACRTHQMGPDAYFSRILIASPDDIYRPHCYGGEKSLIALIGPAVVLRRMRVRSAKNRNKVPFGVCLKAAASVRHSGGLFRVHWTASQTRSDPRLSPAEGVQRVQSFRDCRQRTGESRELSGPSRTCMGSSSGHLAPPRGSILKLCTLRNPTPSCTLNATKRLGYRAAWRPRFPPHFLGRGRLLLATRSAPSARISTPLLLERTSPAISAARQPARHPQMPL